MQLLKTLLPSLSVAAAIVAPCHVRADVAHLLPKVKELSVNATHLERRPVGDLNARQRAVAVYGQLRYGLRRTYHSGGGHCLDPNTVSSDYNMVIPEIDMPGHSAAFTRAMGFSMQTDQGIVVLKVLPYNILFRSHLAVVPQRGNRPHYILSPLRFMIDSATEKTYGISKHIQQIGVIITGVDAPYIHIGADEVSLTYPGFLEIMTKYVQDTLHRKVVVWNPISNCISISGMTMTPRSAAYFASAEHCSCV